MSFVGSAVLPTRSWVPQPLLISTGVAALLTIGSPVVHSETLGLMGPGKYPLILTSDRNGFVRYP